MTVKEPNYWLMKSEPDAYSIDTLISNEKEVCSGCGCVCPCDCSDCKECSSCKDQ